MKLKDPVVYPRSLVWDFWGRPWVWNRTEPILAEKLQSFKRWLSKGPATWRKMRFPDSTHDCHRSIWNGWERKAERPLCQKSGGGACSNLLCHKQQSSRCRSEIRRYVRYLKYLKLLAKHLSYSPPPSELWNDETNKQCWIILHRDCWHIMWLSASSMTFKDMSRSSCFTSKIGKRWDVT